MDIRIFLTNLGAYNRGNLMGKWIELPIREDVLEAELQIVLGDDEEYFITDYEAPFEIHEYENLRELNKFSEKFVSQDEYEQEIIKFLLTTRGYSREEVFELVSDVVFYNGMNLRELAELLVDQGLFGEIPEIIKNYIDYDLIARDLSFDGYYETREGVFYVNQ